MNLYVRADADSKIGIGHIMRCIALAQSWHDAGGKVTFITRFTSNSLKDRIESEGFKIVSIDHVCPDPSDLKNTSAILDCDNTDKDKWLVLDGYHFDSAYQKRIKESRFKLLCIDDYGHADHYYADIILNQNINADKSFYNYREPYTKLLLSTRYALLRREFKQWQNWQRDIPPIAQKVLVTLGGGDHDNATLKVISALKKINISGLEVKIIVGPANPNLQELIRVVVDNSNLQIITNATNMPELMAWADIAITAGGSTCWEMALLGVPNIIITFARNQQPIAEKLYKTGMAIYLGRSSELTIESIVENLTILLLSQEKRIKYSQKSRNLVDGSGAQRVCQEIM